MNKKYFVRYVIETPNSIANRKGIEGHNVVAMKFNLDKTEISLYDHKYGLISDSYLEAESLDEAEQKSKVFIENILNLIDYSTSSASGPALLVIAYDATDDLNQRAFKQIIYKSLLERNIKVVKQEIFEDIFKAFDKNKDARIVRATSWLRKAYLEKNYIDKFIAYWTGLESINDLLCDFFLISAEDRKWKCSCGRTILPVSSVGIKTLFLDAIKIDNRQFSKIRNARNDLIHGNAPLDDNFVEEIKQYSPICKKALIVGIGILLGIGGDIIDEITKEKTATYSEKIRLIIEANLKNFTTPKLEELGRQPRFEITDESLLERIVDNQGKLSIKRKMGFKAINADFDIKALESRGDDDSSIEKSEFGNFKINKSKD